MVARHEEIFPTTELFPSCKRENCDASTKGKSIHVVGSVCACVAHQRERYHLEGVQEVFREEIPDQKVL
jgi:hypothetical protein